MLLLDKKLPPLLEGHKLGAVGGTDTWAPVFDRLVRNGEFAQGVSNHFGFQLNGIKSLSIVHSNNGPNHFRNDNHVPEMGLDSVWFLTDGQVLFGNTEFLQERRVLALESSLESSASAAVQEVHQLFFNECTCPVQDSQTVYLLIVQFEELFQVDTSESKLFKSSLLLDLLGLCRIESVGLVLLSVFSIKCICTYTCAVQYIP